MRSAEYLVVIVLLAGLCAAGCVGETSITNESAQMAGTENEVKTAPVNGVDIAYQTYGDGMPMILCMGYAGTMDMWSPELIDRLSEDHQVVVFDYRGMGLSGPLGSSKDNYTMQTLADDTKGLMDALNISRADVLGWSMGTYVAQNLVLSYPDAVDHLILYAGDCGGAEYIQPAASVEAELANTSGTSEERGMRLLQLILPGEWMAAHPDIMSYFPQVTETSSPESVQQQYRAIGDWVEHGTYARLPEIQSPTLLLTGTEDILTPPENSFVMGERITGSWVVQMKGGGHGLMYQYPAEMSAIIQTFIETSITNKSAQMAETEKEVKLAPVHGVNIAYQTYGNGTPMILCMGYGGTMDMWSPALIERLAEDHQVIVFDYRGMGLSGPSEDNISIQTLADDTKGLMDVLNISSADVLGYSMGTYVAQNLVLSYPDAVDHLILYAGDSGGKECIQPAPLVEAELANTSGTSEERGMRLLPFILPQEWMAAHPDIMSYCPVVTETSSSESVQQQYLAIGDWMEHGTYARLPEIKSSTLILTGTEDIVRPPENSFVLGERITGSWVVQIKGGGHGVMYQYPAEMAAIIRTFIETT